MKHYKKMFFSLGICLLIILGMEAWSWGAGYPEKPINMIVPFPPGGPSDLSTRTIASFLESSLKQTVVVMNKPGGMNLIGGNVVATAKPDGYTLGYLPIMAAIPETFAHFQQAPYNSKDLTPVCQMVNFPGVLIVKGDSPWKGVKDFVEYARQNPGVKVGTRGAGSIPSLMLMAIHKAENVKFTDVPFPGDPAITTAVLGGHVLAGISTYSVVRPQAEAGNLRALLLYTKKRLESAPDIPCVADLGYTVPVFPIAGIFGPKNLQGEVIEKIYGSMKKIVEIASFREKFKSLELELIFENPEDTRKTLERYQTEIQKFYKELGFWKD